MIFRGLSLDQAPPFGAVLRFFLTAPLFGVIAGALMLFLDPAAYHNRYAPQAIALVHLLTLGFFTMVMAGALQQMLPVLAGAKFPKPLLLAALIHVLLTAGTVLLAAGFAGAEFFLKPAVILLGGALLLFLFAAGYALVKASSKTPTVLSMKLSLLALLGVFLLGLYLAAAHAFGHIGAMQPKLSLIHMAWAFFGWIGILVIGVAYQVIPMFYVTPPYPQLFLRWLPAAIFVLLSILTLSLAAGWEIESFLLPLLALASLSFAAITLRILQKRKRAVSDTTVWYWWLAMTSLALGSLLLVFLVNGQNDTLVWLAATLLGLGFVMSLINGMLYKIITFLTWFHLSSMGIFDLPTMREMIPEYLMRTQFFLHLAMLSLFLLSAFVPVVAYAGGVLMIFSNLLLFYNLTKPARLFFRLKKSAVFSGSLQV